ncbi:MAG: toll/interleukin-1 receptor domain-containing protein [Terricaulis sp.]
MPDIFLSYAREDRARAEQVAQGLQAAGLAVFWDNEIPPGKTWADYIEEKLTQCRALIVLWSEHSTKSQWVREEARMGRDKGVLIPVMIDAAQPPFGFGEVQAANLSDWTGDASDPRWQRLVNAVKAFESTERPTPRPMEPPRAAAPQQAQSFAAPQAGAAAKKSIPPWVWIVGAVVATIMVLGVIGNMYNEEGATTPQQQANDAPQQPVMQQPAVQPPQAGGTDYSQQVLARLTAAQQQFVSQGFQPLSAAVSGQLAQGGVWNVPVTLQAGGEYRIVGVCDNDCGDFDLVLYDAANNVVSRDELTDAIPVVSVQPQYNGQFVVQAVMHTCNQSPCYYALALYGRPVRQ